MLPVGNPVCNDVGWDGGGLATRLGGEDHPSAFRDGIPSSLMPNGDFPLVQVAGRAPFGEYICIAHDAEIHSHGREI